MGLTHILAANAEFCGDDCFRTPRFEGLHGRPDSHIQPRIPELCDTPASVPVVLFIVVNLARKPVISPYLS
jgi:hypothetical protein